MLEMVARSVRVRFLSPGPKEFDEFFHHAGVAQQFGDGEHQVGGGDPLVQGAAELDADHLGNGHVVGLAQHDGLGLDAAHTPAHDADAVDHGGVRVGAHQGVGVGDGAVGGFLGDDHPAQILQVDLVADARVGGYHGEVVEAFLGPLEQLVAFAVALVFFGHVLGETVGGAVIVHLDAVVDDELGGHQGVDLARVAAQLLDCIAHGRQIHHGRHSREILHEDPGRVVGDLHRRIVTGLPVGDGFQIVRLDHPPVQLAQEVLHQDLDGVGQTADIADALGGQLLDVIIADGVAVDLDRLDEIFVVHGGVPYL
jgi:hypothetical protein